VSQSNGPTCYLGVTLHMQLTWSPHIDQVRKKAAQKLGVLGSLLNRRSGLSITNRVLLHKQLIHPMTDYTCPIWRFAARTHVGEAAGVTVQVSAPCYQCTLVHCNMQIHKNLGVPFFANHIGALTKSVDSKTADVGQRGQYLR